MRAFLSILCLGFLMILPACDTLKIGDPAQTEGAIPSEFNELRLIRASLVVKAAYDTVGAQFDKGLITVEEAQKAKDVIDRASEGVKIAAVAVEALDGTAEQKLDYLDSLILQVLMDQALKGAI